MSDINKEIVYQAIGHGSMCWNPRPSGEFDSTEALKAGQPVVDAMEAQQATIEKLEKELAEARDFIVADYSSYPAYNPYAHELRRLYPWLEALAAKPNAVQSTKALLKKKAAEQKEGE